MSQTRIPGKGSSRLPAEADGSSFSQCPSLIGDKLDPNAALPAKMKTQNENAQPEGPV
jgi:hypothetical protein